MPNAVSMQADSIHTLGEQIGTKLAKAEEMGADGNVEESLKLMEEVEELKKAKTAAEVRKL
jgi:RNA-binding protein Luc7-like 2